MGRVTKWMLVLTVALSCVALFLFQRGTIRPVARESGPVADEDARGGQNGSLARSRPTRRGVATVAEQEDALSILEASRVESRLPLPDKRQSGIETTLHTPVEVHGRVASPDGQPLKRGRLRIRPLLGGQERKPVICPTDDQGRYFVRLKAPEAYIVDAEWIDPLDQPVVLAGNLSLRISGLTPRQERDFQVPNRGTLSIRVLGPRQERLSETPVRIVRRGLIGISTSASSDRRGEIRKEVAEGVYHLSAFLAKDGLAGQTEARVAPFGVTRAVLQLESIAHVLTGRVVDRNTDQALFARVDVFREGQRHLDPGGVSVAYPTDSEGSFAVPIPKDGVYWIRVRSTGYKEFASTLLDFPVAAVAMRDLLVRMEPGQSLAGTVRDWNKVPVSGAQVHLRVAETRGSLKQVTTQTGEDGEFLFQGLTETSGELWADFSYGRSEMQKVSIPDLSIVLELQPSGIVEGRVVWPDGRPFTEAFTLVLIRSGPISVDSFIPIAGMQQDPQGRFSINAVPAGRYRLQANALRNPEVVSGESISARSSEFDVTLDRAPSLLVVMGEEGSKGKPD